MERVPMTITVHAYKNRAELIRNTQEYHTQHERGLAVWNKSGGRCHIYVVRPKKVNDKEFETWGHELAHCVYGTFH